MLAVDPNTPVLHFAAMGLGLAIGHPHHDGRSKTRFQLPRRQLGGVLHNLVDELLIIGRVIADWGQLASHHLEPRSVYCASCKHGCRPWHVRGKVRGIDQLLTSRE